MGLLLNEKINRAFACRLPSDEEQHQYGSRDGRRKPDHAIDYRVQDLRCDVDRARRVRRRLDGMQVCIVF